MIRIRVGYDMVFECVAPTPMTLMLNVHDSRLADLETPDRILCTPVQHVRTYRDIYGNRCARILAPEGLLSLSARAVVRDDGLPDNTSPQSGQTSVQDLPDHTLLYLLGSRYCETDRLSEVAWQLFGHTPPGWQRVQAICDFVHQHITFGYEHARVTMTAWEAWQGGVGVCRDFAHLAITFCRCMNIPARYCTGYLGDIAVPPADAPMDFAGWMEVYLSGRWYTFDPRNNVPRVGRVLIARGRDATDVAISHALGANKLTQFSVYTDQIA